MPKTELYNVTKVIESLEKSYKNVSKRKPIYGYDGPLLTINRILSVTPNIDQEFDEESIQYHKERDRSKLYITLKCAFQLGIEQGVHLISHEPHTLPHKNWTSEEWDDFMFNLQMIRASSDPVYYKKMIQEKYGDDILLKNEDEKK